MKKTVFLIAAVMLAAGCRNSVETGYFLPDTDAVPMGIDKTVYPSPGAYGEIPDEAWADFRYEAEYHIISTSTGRRLSDSVFSSLSVFSDGVAIAAGTDGGLFYVGKDGRRIIGETFRDATLFSGGRAWVMGSDGEIWAIDKAGNRLFPADGAAAVSLFLGGKAVIWTVDGYTKVVDSRGNVLLNVKGYGDSFVVDGLIPMSGRDGRQGLMDMKGNFTVPPEYCYVGLSQWSDVNAYISSLSSGRFIVSDGDAWGVLGSDGEMKIPMAYYEIVSDGSLFLAYGKDGAVWFDADGNKVIEGGFSLVSAFGDGDYAAVCKDEEWGFIGRDGKWLIEPGFCCYASSFDANGRAVFNDDDTFMAGMIDSSGAVMVEPVYSYIYNIRGTDRYIFGKDDHVGIMDRNGRIVLPADLYTIAVADPSDSPGPYGYDDGGSYMLLVADGGDL